MKPLDMRDIAIIDAFPIHDYEKVVLNVGCGEGRIDYHLAEMRYFVYATDIEKPKGWEDTERLRFHLADIFKLTSFPILSPSIVICSEVLEHLNDYKRALENLLELTKVRLIITVPFEKSFGGENAGHCNFWGDDNIGEFYELCKPYSVAISKIRTKPRDVQMRQFCYLIVVDKRQDK